MKKILYTLFFLLAVQFVAFSQSELFIDNSISVEQMVEDFFDNTCVTPSNITVTGGENSIAFFEAGNTDLGVNAGIVISSGNVFDLINPSSFFATSANTGMGDADLESQTTATTNDVSILEFDIAVSSGGDLSFQYVFGSEEYPEFVGSSFNDVFAFFINETAEPNLNNIAMLPNGNGNVTINNVNANINSDYYVPYADNGGQHIALDGLTTELFANFTANANGTYHVKIGVADVGDQIFDSAVFIGIESLCGSEDLVPNAIMSTQVDNSTVSITNESRYGTSWHWDFGDNTTSEERNPAPHTYANDGTYTITLTTENWCCSATTSFDVQIGAVNTGEAIERPFSIYPNPSSEVIQVNLTNEESFEYEIRSLEGKLQRQGQLQGSQSFDISELPLGIYQFILKNKDQFYSEKIIKN